MMRGSLIAAALLAVSSGAIALSSVAASAEGMRAEQPWTPGPYDRQGSDSYGSPIGVNRYCPPGEIPHVFPNGNGVRCQTLDGYYR